MRAFKYTTFKEVHAPFLQILPSQPNSSGSNVRSSKSYSFVGAEINRQGSYFVLFHIIYNFV